MKLNRFTVSFEEQDMNFLKTHGIFKASNIVKKHYKKYRTPFIYDTYQLARTIAVPRNMLFDLSRNASKHYKLIMLRKRNGGIRYIHSPDEDLKHAQKQILRKILNNIDISPYATAYISGKKLKDNAIPHINHKYLLKMDITDFFGSITYLQVISSAFNSNIFPVQIGAMLASLCCLEDVLPQGAPTSPMLSNIVMKNFDDIIGNWCKKKNITYTRYCDDLTFSADIPLYGVYLKVKEMLLRRGFEVNESKTKFVSSTSCQLVTGLTVNEKVSIPREYKRQLRQEVYYALKFGFAESIMQGDRVDFITKGSPNCVKYFAHLKGQVNYVLQIEPNNSWFRDAFEKLDIAYIQKNMRYPN